MSNVISIKPKLEIAQAKRNNEEYKTRIDAMDKLGLLEEMVSYQEMLAPDNPLDNILKGLILFRKLQGCAETEELKETVTFYISILEMELKTYESSPDADSGILS